MANFEAISIVIDFIKRMKIFKFPKTLCYLLITLTILACSKNNIPQTIHGSPAVNSSKTLEKPYLILISLDGFRWDYVERFKPPYMSAFIAEGMQAASIIPSFPSKTFPNHYTLATGMYPDHHGIIGNSFYRPDLDLTYTVGNRERVQDSRFYKGTPIWVQAAKEGMVTASYFFVGTETEIQGIQPTYYFDYNKDIDKEERVSQALKWLALPKEKRPHLITMYFEDMDDIGHAEGPNNDKALRSKLISLDSTLGTLFEGVKKTGLPVNIIIASDHGMLEVPTDKYLSLDIITNEEAYLTVSNGAMVSIHPKDPTQTEAIFKELKAKEHLFKVYKTTETPGFEYTPTNSGWGPIQIIPDPGYYFTSNRAIAYKKNTKILVSGEHGFDPKLQEMNGILYGNGPAFKKGYRAPAVKNIHLYPLMCEILGLRIPKEVDGKLSELEEVLAK